MILIRPTLALGPVVYAWMTAPGIVEHIYGAPTFPENPVPSLAEFLGDFVPFYFTHAAPEFGRLFLMAEDGELVGAVTHNDVVTTATGVLACEIDIWLARAELKGRGYGRRGVLAVCEKMADDLGVAEAFLQPSARNPMAVRAYAGAGFVRSPLRGPAAALHFGTALDFADAVFLVKQIA